MLPKEWKYFGANDSTKEPWDCYWRRQTFAQDEATMQFVRQALYDHFASFEAAYPTFQLHEWNIGIETWTATDICDHIRYFDNKAMDFYCEQFDEFERSGWDSFVFQEMAGTGTFPFPPVVIESSLLVDDKSNVYGRPFHLIEGCHRMSYLRRMLERLIIAAESKHSLVVLRPVESN